MKKTVLTKLIERLEEVKIRYPFAASTLMMDRAIAEAKSLLPEERKVIEETYNDGWFDDGTSGRTGIRYFNETFTQKLD